MLSTKTRTVSNICHRQLCRRHCYRQIFVFHSRGKKSIKFLNIVADNELTCPDRSNSVDKHLVNVSYFIYLFGFCSVLLRPLIRSAYFYFILLLFLILYIILYYIKLISVIKSLTLYFCYV
jgi:hypothetical protein